MKKIILVIFLLLVISHAEGKQQTDDIGTLVIQYDDRFNSGRDFKIRVQVNFNISKLEIILDREDNDSLSIYNTGRRSDWILGDWIEKTVAADLISVPGEYQTRIIAYPQNRNLTVLTHFISFKVLAVLDLKGVAISSSLIGLIFVSPFIYSKSKARIEVKLWGHLTMRQYFLWYPRKLVQKLKKYFLLHPRNLIRKMNKWNVLGTLILLSPVIIAGVIYIVPTEL